jgi:hypothetical protein
MSLSVRSSISLDGFDADEEEADALVRLLFSDGAGDTAGLDEKSCIWTSLSF